MKTHPSRSLPLQGGHVFNVERARHARIVVLEGEVRVQAAPRVLAGAVFTPPALHVAAPGEIEIADASTVTAVGGARLHVESRPGLLAAIASALVEARSKLMRGVRLVQA